jgi:hypothetical protein
MNLLTGVVGLLAVTVAVVVINPLLHLAPLVATLPNAWAVLEVGDLKYRTFMAGTVRRRGDYAGRGGRRSGAEDGGAGQGGGGRLADGEVDVLDHHAVA